MKKSFMFSRNSPDTQQGNCYTRLTSNLDCTEPLGIKLSKKDCCCGKDMGKGWGNTCEHCPSLGMGKYCYIVNVKYNFVCDFPKNYTNIIIINISTAMAPMLKKKKTITVLTDF